MENLHDLAIIWCSVFFSILVAKLLHFTPVLFFLLSGAILVNLGWLSVEPSPFIEGLSNIGILFIMFALGFEESTSRFIHGIKRSWGITFFGATIPFLVSYFFAWTIWQDFQIALVCGLVMMASAVSIVLAVFQHEGLRNSAAATGVMAAAILDNIAVLALVAVLIPIAFGEVSISVLSISWIVMKSLMFFSVVVMLGAWIFPSSVSFGWMRHIPFVGRWGLRELFAFDSGHRIILLLLILALLLSLLAHQFGLHPAVGAYMAGLVLKEEYFDLRIIGERRSFRSTKQVIDDIAFTWIGPIFFVELGTKLIFDWEMFKIVVPETLILTSAIFISQVLSVTVASRYTAGFKWHESVLIGFGMLGRAELAFVIMDMGYVQKSILSTEAFYTLMFTAFLLNILVPICFKLWKPFIQKPP